MNNDEINREETIWKKERFRKDNNTKENFETNTNPDVLYINQKIKKINKRKKYKEMFNSSEPLTNIYETESTNIFNSHNVDTSDFGKKSILETVIDNAGLKQDVNKNKNENIDENKNKSNISDLFNMNDLFKCKKSKNKDNKNNTDNKNVRSEPGCNSCENFDNNNKETKKKLQEKEGFSQNRVKINISTFVDPIKDVMNSISDFIFYFPKKINNSIDIFSEKFVKIFYTIDGNDDDEHINNLKNDSNIIKSIVYLLAMFPISIYICYNWMFLTVYKDSIFCDDKENQDENTDPSTEEKKCRPCDDNKRYKISFDNLNIGLRSLLNFILDFSIQPIYWFDNVILGDNKFPALLNMIPYKIIMKLVILIFAITTVYAFDIYTVFNDIMLGGVITGQYNAVSIFCTTIIFVYYFYWIFKDLTFKQISPTSPEYSMKFVEYISKWIMSPLITLFFTIIKYVVRFILAVWNIGISKVLLTLFIWIHSMFGMALYGGGLGNIKNTMNDVDSFVNIDLEKLKEDNPEYIEYSLFRKILISVASFLYNNLYYFVYLILIMGSVVASIAGIKSYTLKTVISVFISIQGFGMIFLMWLNRLGKQKTSDKQFHANKYTVPSTST